MSLTPLHILTFYNAVANKGKMLLPIFSTDILKDGKTVIKTIPRLLTHYMFKIISKAVDLLKE